MKWFVMLVILFGAVFVGLVAAGEGGWNRGPVVVTLEGEQKLVLRLGEAVRVADPGLSWIIPGLEKAEPFDVRWNDLDSEPNLMQTRDGEQLTIDSYVIWRVVDVEAFRRSFQEDRERAVKRIDRAMRDDVREVIGRHTLHEVLDKKRGAIMQEITENTRADVKPLGIAVADVRINRTELPAATMNSVYARMKTERERLARKTRAEGEERARKIRADADAEARVLVAKARRDAEITKGEGDAEATRLYGESYGNAPEFYAFTRSLEAYRKTINANTTLVLSPDSEFFRFFESAGGNRRPPASPSGEPERTGPRPGR